MTAATNTLTYLLNAAVYVLSSAAVAVREDARVRWGLGAGASILLSAGILGLGGSIIPDFSRASGIPGAPVAQAQGVSVVDMSTSTVSQIIEMLPKAERFELMLYNSGASEVLKHKGNYTVFVPANAYFDYLPKGYIASLNKVEMKQLSLGHMVGRALPIEESLNGNVPTLGDTLLTFEVNAGAQTIEVGDAQVIKAYQASNGMVYLIDQVLVPEGN